MEIRIDATLEDLIAQLQDVVDESRLAAKKHDFVYARLLREDRRRLHSMIGKEVEKQTC